MFFSACYLGKIDPHEQKNYPFALCSLQAFALRHSVYDYDLGDVSVYLLNVQPPLCVGLLPYLFLDTEK